jgi:Domain of unknown function (DUF4424)
MPIQAMNESIVLNCPDDSFVKAFNKLPNDTAMQRYYPIGRNLEYRLVTGGNWAGPIGQFRLNIDKANAELVTLCPIPGLKLTKQGRSFVAETVNYMPASDIKVMLVFSLSAALRFNFRPPDVPPLPHGV